jgi:hypothetical protein
LKPLLGQELGVGGDQILVLVLDVVLVEVEVDAALRQDALRIGQFARQAVAVEAVGGRPWRRRCLRDSTGAPFLVGIGVVELQPDQGGKKGGDEVASVFSPASKKNYSRIA